MNTAKKLKIKDITEEWEAAILRACPHTFMDGDGVYIGWKDIRDHGYDAVSISGEVWSFNKHGLIEVLL